MKQLQNVNSSICPKFEKAFTILGKKWNGLIIDVLLENGPRRFGELKQEIPELSDRVLVERLKELERENIITKSACFPEGARCGYRLTQKGEDLQLVITQIQRWAEKWIEAEECS